MPALAARPVARVTNAVMLAFVVAASLLAQAPAPAPQRLKVLVLDVQSTDLTESERTTLTNLEAAQLAENTRLEVLSGEDIKQLVKLQGQAQDLGVDGNCTDACMAELAGALGAGVVVATQVGKLGETLVVTLVVFDAAKAKSVSRKSVQATSLGELPSKIGPVLDALVQPLLPALPGAPKPIAPVVVEPPPPPPPKPKEMSPRLRELYDVEAMGVCFDPANRGAWWFCNRKQAFTENVFVREYEKVTGLDDIRRADVNRGKSVVLPIGGLVLGTAGAGALSFTMVCGFIDGQPCGADVQNALLESGGALAFGLAIGGALVAIVGLTVAADLLDESRPDPDGTPVMHTLTEAEARGAIDRYNEALKEKLARDLGE